MKKSKIKKDFPTKFFVVGSLAGLFVLGAIFYLIEISLLNLHREESPQQEEQAYERYIKTDPFITKVVTLKDIIDGPIINDFDPYQGSRRAPISIVYFTDFECNYCYQQEEDIKKIIDEFAGQVFLIRKDYPKLDPESFSWQASVAGRCAVEQGKFWDFHDALYKEISSDGSIDLDNINKYANSDFFVNLASKAGARKGLFAECLQDEEIISLVQDNILEAEALGIKGIPFIYINGREIMGGIGYEDLKILINRELEKMKDNN